MSEPETRTRGGTNDPQSNSNSGDGFTSAATHTGSRSVPKMSDPALSLLRRRVNEIDPGGWHQAAFKRFLRAGLTISGDKEEALDFFLDSVDPHVFAHPTVLIDRSLHLLLRDVLLYLNCHGVPPKSTRARMQTVLPPILFQDEDLTLATSLITDFNRARTSGQQILPPFNPGSPPRSSRQAVQNHGTRARQPSPTHPPPQTRDPMSTLPLPPLALYDNADPSSPLPSPTSCPAPRLVPALTDGPRYHGTASSDDDRSGLLRTLATRWTDKTKYSGSLDGITLENLRNSYLSSMQENSVPRQDMSKYLYYALSGDAYTFFYDHV